MALLLFSSVMLKFNRLAQMSKEAEVIAGAVAKSTSGLLEVRDVASLSCIAIIPFLNLALDRVKM